jgi:hypothetical protein
MRQRMAARGVKVKKGSELISFKGMLMMALCCSKKVQVLQMKPSKATKAALLGKKVA